MEAVNPQSPNSDSTPEKASGGVQACTALCYVARAPAIRSGNLPLLPNALFWGVRASPSRKKEGAFSFPVQVDQGHTFGEAETPPVPLPLRLPQCPLAPGHLLSLSLSLSTCEVDLRYT